MMHMVHRNLNQPVIQVYMICDDSNECLDGYSVLWGKHFMSERKEKWVDLICYFSF